MVMKYWARDSGKSIYHGPEEDMLEHMERDSNCVEVPEDRPTPYHNWENDGWVEDDNVKSHYFKARGNQQLEEDRFYQFLTFDDAAQERQKMAYLTQLAEVAVGRSFEMPTKPDFME